MKNKFMLAFASCLLFSSASLLFASKEIPLNSKQVDIIQKFRDQGHYTELKKIKVVKPESGANVDIIIFMKSLDGSCPVVAKVLKYIHAYNDERTALKKDQILIHAVNALKKNCPYKLPYIIEYIDDALVEGQGVILLTKAKGRTLYQISQSLNMMPDEAVSDMFKTIGQQLGTLDALLYKYTYNKILYHPDGQLANMTYDEKEKQLYWLDTSGVALQDFKDDFSQNHGGLADKIEYFVTHSPQSDKEYRDIIKFYSLEDAKEARTSLLKFFLAFKNLYEGYAKALDEGNVPNTIKSQYNGKFGKTFPKLNEYIKRVNDALSEKGLDQINLIQ